jgi:acyl-CoA thioester hydrolase
LVAIDRAILAYFFHHGVPQTVDAGIQVSRLGSSGVRYEVGLFTHEALLRSLSGSLVHVYVDKVSQPNLYLSHENRS